MNDENLIPFGQRTVSEEREIQSKGGIASGKSRRAVKSLKQAAKVFFSENPDAAMNVIIAMYNEALDGNVKAADKLQDLIGETVQREELTLKKKTLAKQNAANTGKTESLIAALQEDENAESIHTETTSADETVEKQQP